VQQFSAPVPMRRIPACRNRKPSLGNRRSDSRKPAIQEQPRAKRLLLFPVQAHRTEQKVGKRAIQTPIAYRQGPPGAPTALQATDREGQRAWCFGRIARPHKSLGGPAANSPRRSPGPSNHRPTCLHACRNTAAPERRGIVMVDLHASCSDYSSAWGTGSLFVKDH
jgi:hypothetical protein